VVIEHYLQLLHYYRKLLIAIVLGITGAVVAIGWIWLMTFPLYSATADVTILPTDAELSFTKGFLTGSQYNPANVMTQTQIEYLLSRPVAEKALELVTAQDEGGDDPAPTGFKRIMTAAAQTTLRTIRKVYNVLNSGKHVPLTPYEDALETIMDSISLEVVEGSYILEITVTLPKRSASAVIANSLAEAYVRKAQEDTVASSAAMTKYLEDEIAKRQAMLNRVSDREAEMLQGEIAATRDRLADVQMAQASVLSQVRVINPAVTPVYATYPKIVIYSLIGFAASVVIALFVVVLLDTVTDTVKTLPDLRRLVGERALGRLSPEALGWIRSGFKLKGRRHYAGLQDFAASAVARITALNGLSDARIQVTGFGKRDQVASSSVAVAAALAQAGHRVLCDRRASYTSKGGESAASERRNGSVPVPLALLPTSGGKAHADTGSGSLVFSASTSDGDNAQDVTIACHGPISADFWQQNADPGPVVVCLPSGEITEGMVHEFRREAEKSGVRDVFFILMAA
jgi:capsular polysaccharide biosynthesis protein